MGKSAIAEGLALRIYNKEVSRVLFDKRVVSLDLASLVAGTKYRGQFEERMKALMNELEKMMILYCSLTSYIPSSEQAEQQVASMHRTCSSQH